MKLTQLLIIGLLTVIPVTAEQATETKLLPAVKQLLIVPNINEKAMEQNAYVWLLTINGPKSTNYFSVAKRIILNNNRLLQQAVATKDNNLLEHFDDPRNYFGEKYWEELQIESFNFPCSALSNSHCIDDILKDKEHLMQLIEKNKILLGRYQNILKLPNYKAYDLVFEMPTVAYLPLLLGIKLRLAEAIFNVEQGHIQQGLAIIQQEVDFNKNKLLTGGHLMDSVVAIRNLLVSYHVLQQLLDDPKLSPYLNDPQFVQLLQPLTDQQQQKFANVLAREQKFALLTWHFTTMQSIQEELDEYAELEEKDDEEYIEQAIKLGYPLKYDYTATMNLVYQNWQRLISTASLVLPAASEQYLIDKKFPKTTLTIEQIYKKYGANNLYAGIIIEQSDYTNYINRFYDLNNYLWLINAKLKIKQAAITKQQVPEFLTNLADKAKNPYSQQPFKWDANRQILSSDWLSRDVDMTRDGARANITIEFK